jgi:hypothetical protein
MKITDFGLWFFFYGTYEWLATTPPEGDFHIYYDGVQIGTQWSDFFLAISSDTPHIIKLKKDFPNYWDGRYDGYNIGRPLPLDDFEIILNPDYKGDL